MSMKSITAVNGEVYTLYSETFRQIEEISYDWPIWSTEEVIQCWCLLRRAVYSRYRKPSAIGILNQYKPTLLKLSDCFEVESILSVISDGGRLISTPKGLYELVMQELG